MNQDQAGASTPEQVEQTPAAAPKASKKGKGKVPGKAKKAAPQVDWNSPALMKAIEKAYPVGSRVEYTGTRVKAHAGKTGVVTGYRNGNGLVIDFGKAGIGSITKAKAKLLSRGKKGSKETGSEPEQAASGE